MWRLTDLVELVNRVLPYEEEAGVGESRRVCWAPNERLVRYYTSLALVDRPAEMRGRTAYYGMRHLLQLVAIKRLQLDGQTLRIIQGSLSGMPDADLEEIARLRPGWRAVLEESPDEDPGVATASEPATPADAQPQPVTPFWERAPRIAVPTPAPAEPRPATLTGVVLAPEVILLLNAEQLNLIDMEELRHAAGTLLKLIAAHPVPGTADPDRRKS